MQVNYKWSTHVIPTGISLSSHCNFKEITSLKVTLGKRELLKQFLCVISFRYFMEISNNQLLVCLLITTIFARELKIRCASPDEILFKIRGQPYRFEK